MSEEERQELFRYHLLPTDFRLVFRVLSLFVSWYFNKSILWGILHFYLGWIYLSYVLFIGGFNEGGIARIINFYFN